MTGLSQIAYYAQKIIKYTAIGILSFFIIKAGYSLIKNIWLYYYPPEPDPPTVSFGKLPAPNFPLTTAVDKLEFILETATGRFPEFNSQIKVYRYQPPQPNLLALQKAEEEISQLGFLQKPKQLSAASYQWLNNYDNLNRELEMDIYTGAFKYSYDWQTRLDPSDNLQVLDKEQAVVMAKNYLKNINRLALDLEEGRIETEYLSLKGAKMLTAPSLSEAQFTKVNFFRREIDGFPIMTADLDKGIVSFIFSGSIVSEKKIISVEYNYFPLDYENSATYPLKPISEAWSELLENEAIIINYDQTSGAKVTIRRIFLAYYDSFLPQDYLQPIYIFTGDNNFYALVSAIPYEWLK